MVMIDYKREGDVLFRHLQCSQGRVLMPKEPTKVPMQRFRSPIYPTEATESTVQYPLVCIALLSKALLYRVLYSLQFHSCSSHNAQHSTSIVALKW